MSEDSKNNNSNQNNNDIDSLENYESDNSDEPSNNEDIETLEDDGDLLNEDSENDYDYEYNDGSQQITPEEQVEQQDKPKKLGEDAYKAKNGNKNFYKENKEKLKEKKEEAKEKKEKAKEEVEKAKEKKKEAKEKKKEAKDGDKDEKKAARKDYREAKKDVRKAKRKQKEANQAIRDANRRIAKNRIKSLQSKAYQISHPIEATKEYVKQTAKRSVEAKIVALIKKHPFVLIFMGLALFLGLFGIMIFAVLSGGNLGSFEGTSFGSRASTSCNYGTRGINDETVVELINCEATKDNYTVLQTIPLEKYIAGVAIAEMGESYVDEAMKAQLVAVRSYTLTRNIPEYSAGYDSSKNVIRMRACENDQVYWDYTKDIYRSANAVRNGVSKYSPEYTPAEGETPWKKALTTEQINKYEALVSTVMGEFLVDSNDNVIATGYTNTETQKFIEIANNNAGTENGKYTAILLNVYGSSKVNEAVCTVAYSGATGEFTTWKQKTSYGAPWAGVKIGYDKENNKNITINDVGCLIVSISMQITNSGVPTGEIVDFNPGTFAEALKANGNISSSGALNSWDIEKIIPDFKYAGTKYFSYDANNFQSDKLKNYQTIKSYADQGYYIVIEVRKHGGGQHWVALDVANSQNANWQDIYIWDPATNYTSIGAYSKYRANRIAYYKVEKGETT